MSENIENNSFGEVTDNEELSKEAHELAERLAGIFIPQVERETKAEKSLNKPKKT